MKKIYPQKKWKRITDLIPIGIENAISMKELACKAAITERTARELVLEERKSGAPICSVCGESTDRTGGYYMPRTAAEALPYYNIQKSRIDTSIAALKAVKEFIGGGV